MTGAVREKKLDSRAARQRLKKGRQPHWRAIVPGRPIHLGWQCWRNELVGRWILRRWIGNKKYRTQTLGLADDAATADGERVLSYDQACDAVAALVAGPTQRRAHRLTVRQAFDHYVNYKRSLGQPVDTLARGRVHILPVLGDLVVAELEANTLRRWLAEMASAPAQTRPKAGKPQYRPAPASDEDVRRRRATANRVLTILKAALNHAYDEGHVANRDAWGRKLKPFRDVEAARIRYLSVKEAQRLVNACDGEFRPLVRAALETGARYSELARLQVIDFNSDAGTLAIRKTKSGKARHVVLTDDGIVFFKQHCAGRAGHEVMFLRGGRGWRAAEQKRPMEAANERARLKPPVSFHGLRHTWASLAVMNGVPLLVVAKNLGHADTRMVEKHYGHLAPSFVVDAIRAGAPKFGFKPDKKIVAL